MTLINAVKNISNTRQFSSFGSRPAALLGQRLIGDTRLPTGSVPSHLVRAFREDDQRQSGEAPQKFQRSSKAAAQAAKMTAKHPSKKQSAVEDQPPRSVMPRKSQQQQQADTSSISAQIGAAMKEAAQHFDDIAHYHAAEQQAGSAPAGAPAQQVAPPTSTASASTTQTTTTPHITAKPSNEPSSRSTSPPPSQSPEVAASAIDAALHAAAVQTELKRSRSRGPAASHAGVHVDKASRPKSLLERVSVAGRPEVDTKEGPVLVAVDNTDNVQQALEWTGRHLVDEAGDDVVLLHVVADPTPFNAPLQLGAYSSGATISYDAGMEGISRRQAEEHVARLMDKAQCAVDSCASVLHQLNLPYTTQLLPLPGMRSAAGIGEALLRAASARGARLLVVASNYNGPPGTTGPLVEFGSVARFCYQHADIPLVLVPPDVMHLPSATVAAGEGDVLLVVNNLEELASCWQWVADNICKEGDTVHLWHVAGPSNSGMPSLPTTLATALKGRGVGDVQYHCLYCEPGEKQYKDIGEMVCEHASSGRTKAVVLINYSQRGLLMEALHGSVASVLARHCPVPLVLLQPPEL